MSARISPEQFDRIYLDEVIPELQYDPELGFQPKDESQALVESINIGSFAVAGQPQAIPSILRASPFCRYLRHEGMMISTIPLP